MPDVPPGERNTYHMLSVASVTQVRKLFCPRVPQAREVLFLFSEDHAPQKSVSQTPASS